MQEKEGRIMAGEIQLSYKHSANVYVLIRTKTGTIWNVSNSAFEVYATSSYSSYVISAVEQGTASSYYLATFPSAIVAGIYSVIAKERIGVSESETDPTIATGDLQWNGSGISQLSDLITSGTLSQFLPVRIAKGEMIQNFPFKLVSSTDHITPFTSGVVSGQISRNGGVFGVLQSGTVTEIGLGWYKVNFTSGDLNGNTIALSLNANGVSGGSADQRDFAFITQRVSGG